MKRLTINQIASAGLRTGKRAYLSLAVGIFLSIFLITTVAMTAQGAYLASRERQARDIGYIDFFLLDNTDVADSELETSGMFDRIGHVYVSACVTGTTRYLGWYDEEGAALLNRRIEEGRLPENPGEIAMEKSALENIRMQAEVGDTIELELTAVDGVQETRRYLITGFLAEQTVYLSQPNEHLVGVNQFPAILVYPDEPAFSAGRVAVHRLMTKAENFVFSMSMDWGLRLSGFYGVYSRDEIYNFSPMSLYMNEELLMLYVMIGVCALALLIASGTGIAQAMESRLARRREEIGMLRAVGATRRQIRRIFGREAWLLALVLSPVSVAGGCAAAWALSRIAPSMCVFQLNWKLLIPVALFSVLCILISASLPLRRASKIYPMSVIRDTELLRKSRSIRSRKQFKAPRLIAVRQMRLYPTRQIGAMLLVIMMLMCVTIAGGYLLPYMHRQMVRSEDFNMSCSWGYGVSRFLELIPRTAVSGQDINQIAALDQVKRVTYSAEQEIMLLMELGEEKSEYLKEMNWIYSNEHLFEEEISASGEDPYKTLKEVLQIDRDVVITNLIIADSASVSALGPYVAEGKIDMAALNSGREALFLGKDVYLYRDGNGDEWGYSGEPSPYPQDGEPYAVLKNDVVRAGDTLDMIQLAMYMGDENAYDRFSDSYLRDIYADCMRRDASVTVGAVLKDEDLYRANNTAALILTYEGAQALGLNIESPSIGVYLKDGVDEEGEAYVEKRLKAIAMRGEDVSVFNYREYDRQSRKENSSLILILFCAAAVFMAVAVSMIAGNMKRRIQADKRMIGALRAVGADRKALVGCYGGQIEICIAAGLLVSFAFYGWLLKQEVAMLNAIYLQQAPLAVALIAGFAAACWLACRLSLRRSVAEVMKKSIVENIREL